MTRAARKASKIIQSKQNFGKSGFFTHLLRIVSKQKNTHREEKNPKGFTGSTQRNIQSRKTNQKCRADTIDEKLALQRN